MEYISSGRNQNLEQVGYWYGKAVEQIGINEYDESISNYEKYGRYIEKIDKLEGWRKIPPSLPSESTDGQDEIIEEE